MSNRLLKTVALLALTACSGLALADDPPGRVGRVALAEGQVSIASDDQPPAAALVNWPVTSHQVVTTAPGARTELRIGSTSVRLAGGSALEIDELDDERLRLRLHYGSANIRIVNPEAAAGFELATPQARVRMREPGRLRVDAGRVPDTTAVNVFSGVAFVDGAGEELSVRAGRRAEIGDGDVRTGQAMRDGFDDWAYARDQYEDRARSARYVTPEMTGYEDLDRYGSWRNDADYGALWIPAVGPSWVPYRDGSWVWVDPWGWTWVDNAPWGYAPFHYGRWVYVQRHWAWAPGRHDRHPVWSPALVGWVGGANWNVHFNGDGRRVMPAQGWYPLSPHERYVPTWHAPENHLRWWNADVRRDGRRDDYRRDDYRRGLTVVPHDAFMRRDRVPVAQAPKAAPAPLVLQQAPAAAPPPPRERHDQRREDGPRRFERDRFEHGQRPPLATAPPVHAAQAASPVQVLTAPSVPQGQAAPWQRAREDVRRQQFDEARRQQVEQQHRQQLEQERGQQIEQQRRQQLEQQRGQQLEQQQRQQAEQQHRQQFEQERRQQAEQLRRQQFEQQRRQAPAPAPLEAGPVPGPGEPGFVHHGERPPRDEAERERRMREPAAMPPQQARPVFVSPESVRAMAPPPQAARPVIAMPETARPLPLPPQARPATAPPETARPMPMPPQAAPHPVQGPPPQAHPRGQDDHPEHGRGERDRNGRQQER